MLDDGWTEVAKFLHAGFSRGRLQEAEATRKEVSYIMSKTLPAGSLYISVPSKLPTTSFFLAIKLPSAGLDELVELGSTRLQPWTLTSGDPDGATT